MMLGQGRDLSLGNDAWAVYNVMPLLQQGTRAPAWASFSQQNNKMNQITHLNTPLTCAWLRTVGEIQRSPEKALPKGRRGRWVKKKGSQITATFLYFF